MRDGCELDKILKGLRPVCNPLQHDSTAPALAAFRNH